MDTQVEPNPPPAPPSFLASFALGRRPEWTLLRIVVLLLLTFLLLKYVLAFRRIESVSMLPTFREGTVRIIYRLAYSSASPPQRGDIVAVRTSGETIMYIKRIIALPGESVEIRAGTVLINGLPLDEPYLHIRPRPWNWPLPKSPIPRTPLDASTPPRPGPKTLGPSQFLIIGDNRSMRQDLHEFGVVDRSRIIGKVIW